MDSRKRKGVWKVKRGRELNNSQHIERQEVNQETRHDAVDKGAEVMTGRKQKKHRTKTWIV